MMSRKKFVVEFSKDEREHLEVLISKGKSSAKAILKARILLKADQGPLGPSWTDDRIVEALDSNASMVTRVRRQLVEEGLEAVLARKKRATPPITPIFTWLMDFPRKRCTLDMLCWKKGLRSIVC